MKLKSSKSQKTYFLVLKLSKKKHEKYQYYYKSLSDMYEAKNLGMTIL